MTSYIIRRLLLVIPTVFFALSFLFALFYVLPGDPATLIAGGADRNPNAIQVEQINEKYGLNDPLPTQFVNYWKATLQWDLGESFQTGRSVNEILGQRAKNSFRLAFWALIIEIVVGLSVGIYSAIRRYSLADKLTTVGTAAMSAIPVFVLGYILQYAFAVYPNKHDWPEWTRLRTSQIGPPGSGDGDWFLFVIPMGEQWRYLILPAVTLAAVSTALTARMMRGSMLEVHRADFMRTARAKGLGERQIVLRHGLRNAMLPVITLLALDFGAMIGAAVLTETVFSWPGLGSTIASSVLDRDLPVLLGLTLVVVLLYSILNLLVDVSYAWFDPRVRLGEGKDK
ncbi:MAG: ABC transporter permease [Acidimicrobiia bacterium]|nr:ABC transporter permease [Acidimicrobiia bacterium]MDH5237543.1 ABC transporter permease [Acidimicrobiia bacterium]